MKFPAAASRKRCRSLHRLAQATFPVTGVVAGRPSHGQVTQSRATYLYEPFLFGLPPGIEVRRDAWQGDVGDGVQGARAALIIAANSGGFIRDLSDSGWAFSHPLLVRFMCTAT